MMKSEQRIDLQLHPGTSTEAMPSKSTSNLASTSSACRKKKYKGVRMRSWGSWVSEIRAPNQKTRIWLGSYSTAEAAARAYDAALLCLKGSSANLNFPMSASSHFAPKEITIMSPKSIQRAAAAAANTYSAAATTNVTSSSSSPPSPPPQSPPSSSLVSSPSMSSSPSNFVDDDMSSLVGSIGSYTPTYDDDHHHQANDVQVQPMSTLESWGNFDDGLQYSPKYLDQMVNGALFDPPMVYDFYEESDIPLWSFC